MSVRIMSKVWDMDLPSKAKLVLLAVADCANDEGVAWPSIATIARKCGCDPRTVQRNLRDIEKAGLIRREEVIGRGCRYHFSPRQNAAPGKMSPAAKCPKTPGTMPPNPSGTVNGLSNDKPIRAKGWPEIPSWVPATQWNAFIEMRRGMRKRPTKRAVEIILANLEKWKAKGHDPGEILDTSTMNNWAGLFEPKAKANDRQQSKPSGTATAAQRARANLGCH